MIRAAFVTALLLPALGAAQGAVELNRVTRVEVKPGAIEITGSREPNFTTFTMTDPPRLVVDISEAVFAGVPEVLPGQGPVTGVKTASYGSAQAAIARVLIGFASEVETDIESRGNTLVIRVLARPGPGGQEVAQLEAGPPAEGEEQARPGPDAAAEAEARRKQEEAEKLAAQQAEEAKRAEAEAAKEAAARAEAEKRAQEEAARRAAEEARREEEALARKQEEAAREAARKAEEERKRLAAEEAAKKAREEEARRRQAAEEAARRQKEEEARKKKEAEEARRVREAEEAARRAEALERRRLEAEAKAAARRAEEERRRQAEEAARAEAEAKQREAQERRQQEEAAREAARQAEEERRQAQRPAPGGEGRPNTLSLVGFRPLGTGSRVFIRTERPATYEIRESDARTIVVALSNTNIGSSNNARFLDTSFFGTPVLRVNPRDAGAEVEVEITLRDPVPYQARQEGQELILEFQGP